MTRRPLFFPELEPRLMEHKIDVLDVDVSTDAIFLCRSSIVASEIALVDLLLLVGTLRRPSSLRFAVRPRCRRCMLHELLWASSASSASLDMTFTPFFCTTALGLH